MSKTKKLTSRTAIGVSPKHAKHKRAGKSETEGKPASLSGNFGAARVTEAMAYGGGRPVNQRYVQLEMAKGFRACDPIRPSKKHLHEAMDGSRTGAEIDALRELLLVNMCSIARRTPYPEALLWPLVSALAWLIKEYLDERSEYEMSAIDSALLELEIASGGKVRFARSTAPTSAT